MKWKIEQLEQSPTHQVYSLWLNGDEIVGVLR